MKTNTSNFRRRVHKKQARILFDKYDLYRQAVQSPDTDVLFFKDTFKELKGYSPQILREDFCGTFALCTEWVKLDRNFKAIGIDLDPEPLAYGQQKYLPTLTSEQQKRLHIMEADVLSANIPKAHLVTALNFSYFCLKQREQLKKYFNNVYKTLLNKGIFIVDIFGGSQCYDAIEDVNKHEKFTYYWDQTNFDPITNEALFYIHFRIGKKKIEQVFTYDWRMWSIPEVREIMHEVGFKKTHIYWEGTNTKDGTGNGIFTRTEKGESCASWIAYIVAEK